MKEDKIRIILVDDHRLILESWKLLLENDPRFNIIAECENGSEAIKEATLLNPDVILMDINMSPVNGFEATQQIIATNPSIKIIGISINNQPGYATRILELGAKGFVTKGSSFDELSNAIMEVHEGRQYICEEIRRSMN
ncbi:MAG TPA: response regulator transcription factor [Chitinophagaceae bacterium]|nr:response regulator transcription factor [Chitinophagaceae bacterium]